MELECTVSYNGEQFNVVFQEYEKGGNLAVALFDKDNLPYARLTRNFDSLGTKEVALDTNLVKNGADILLEIGFRYTGNYIKSGYCTYPIYLVTDEVIKLIKQQRKKELF